MSQNEKEVEKNLDFTVCPDCGCDEALILAVGILENEGKLRIYCPVCVKYKVIEDIRQR